MTDAIDVRPLAALSVLFQRHRQPERAMVLGLSAMKLDRTPNPGLWLSVTQSLLDADHPEQALTLLGRFEDPEIEFSDATLLAACRLEARVHLRLGDKEAAKAAIARSRDFLPQEPETARTDDEDEETPQ